MSRINLKVFKSTIVAAAAFTSFLSEGNLYSQSALASGPSQKNSAPSEFGQPAKSAAAPAPQNASTKNDQASAPQTSTEAANKSVNPKDIKSIIDLQPFRTTTSIDITDKSGNKAVVTLININPNMNDWFLLTIQWQDGKPLSYHLENSDPLKQQLQLQARYLTGLVIKEGNEEQLCELWGNRPGQLEAARSREQPFTFVCQGKIALRNAVIGNQTTKEWVVDILRDNVWGGEQITSFVKNQFFKDRFLIQSNSKTADQNNNQKTDSDSPEAAQVSTKYTNHLFEAKDLGIEIDHSGGGGLSVGQWYKVSQTPGAYVSVIQPGMVNDTILSSYPKQVDRLDSVENKALSYLVAFDMTRYKVGFALGTDHPRIEWSERAPPNMIDRSLPGPDGIANGKPLITTGMINPALARSVVATFTGGFKRSHGAFKWGALASRNRGSHYGFMESGVIYSTLNPGLATMAVDKQGQVSMMTWSSEDNKSRLPSLLHARQNGVPIIDTDEQGKAIPGEFVNKWGPGNWSGSEDSKFRSLRAGLCLQQEKGKKFLIYGYFSSATPSAMARVFQAYNCQYAIHLDMNALEHTYLAIYSQSGNKFKTNHLIHGMDVLDKNIKGQHIPRFVGFPDNRDFFYIMRRSDANE